MESRINKIPREWSRLIQAREDKGLSQQQLADQIGVRQSLISKWETLFREPSRVQTRLLSKHLGIPLEQLEQDIENYFLAHHPDLSKI